MSAYKKNKPTHVSFFFIFTTKSWLRFSKFLLRMATYVSIDTIHTYVCTSMINVWLYSEITVMILKISLLSIIISNRFDLVVSGCTSGYWIHDYNLKTVMQNIAFGLTFLFYAIIDLNAEIQLNRFANLCIVCNNVKCKYLACTITFLSYILASYRIKFFSAFLSESINFKLSTQVMWLKCIRHSFLNLWIGRILRRKRKAGEMCDYVSRKKKKKSWWITKMRWLRSQKLLTWNTQKSFPWNAIGRY